jgi:hypothetical protein
LVSSSTPLVSAFIKTKRKSHPWISLSGSHTR